MGRRGQPGRLTPSTRMVNTVRGAGLLIFATVNPVNPPLESPVIVAICLFLVLALGVIAYRVRAAWDPFTSNGRRRSIYWLRGWWRGEQAQNRDEH